MTKQEHIKKLEAQLELIQTKIIKVMNDNQTEESKLGLVHGYVQTQSMILADIRALAKTDKM